jgi:hypothetical protein
MVRYYESCEEYYAGLEEEDRHRAEIEEAEEAEDPEDNRRG